MWKRNLLFISLIVAGAAGLLGILLSPLTASRPEQRKVRNLPPPDFQQIVSEVNGQFRREWANAGLHPAESADDLTLARRLSLALMGTIPSLEEIRQLEADASDQRLDRWLAGIYGDRRYTDYLAERLARAFVGTEDGPFLVYRRRRFVSWLSDQVERNRPYDQIVRELIAGGGLWTDQPATNFVTVTVENDKKGPNPERLAARVSRAFLGIRLDCAQCHNHPFQQWKQADFQGLAAFFGQTHQGFTGIYDGPGEFMAKRHKRSDEEAIVPHVPFEEELLPKNGERRERLAAWITHPKNPYLARALVNRMWALLFGRPLVEPLDDLGTLAELPPVLDRLAADFVAHGYDLERLIRVLAATEVFQLSSAVYPEPKAEYDHLWARFPLTRLRPEQVAGAVIQTSSVETLDRETHVLIRIANAAEENEFIKRYGDIGEDEFHASVETIPQRLLLMNGKLVHEKVDEGILNAANLLSGLAPDDAKAVEGAFLAVLSRRPTAKELEHFTPRLADTKGDVRSGHLRDLFWTLINSSEFSWNH
jgi:hypothetical protein